MTRAATRQAKKPTASSYIRIAKTHPPSTQNPQCTHPAHLNRNVTSDEAYAELDKQGLRPADLPELLAFGAKYPDKQREFPIVALGSVWRHFGGGCSVACLVRCGSGRRLDLNWLEGRWSANYRFAAVRKSA